MRYALYLALLALALLPTVATAQDVTDREPVSDDVDAAASSMEDDLQVLSLVAAAAALYHERTGRYPATTFELLGSPEADRTGARALVLSSLTVTPSATGLDVAYGRTPWAEDPTEHSATFTLAPDAEVGGYAARFVLAHRADADFGGRRLLIARQGDLEVRDASGRICVSLDRVATLTTREDWRAAAPYLGEGERLSVGFDTYGGRRVGRTTLPGAAD